MTPTIAVAGATGDLGTRIIHHLRHHDVELRVLTRPGGAASASFGPEVRVVEVSYDSSSDLSRALEGVDVVVSAVTGARNVIVDAQSKLLDASVAAGVRRFIPSDYAADYRRVPPGSNRNFELRREFAAHLDAAPIRATSVLNGAFADMLTGQAPLVVPKLHRILYWSHPDQVLDFTTKDDTARFVADVALDDSAPRYLEIAGDRVTARSLARAMTEISGERYRPLWAGTTSMLATMAGIMRKAGSNDQQAFPAWQGMQYMVSMFTGDSALHHVDNDHYGRRDWTSVTDVLQQHHRQ